MCHLLDLESEAMLAHLSVPRKAAESVHLSVAMLAHLSVPRKAVMLEHLKVI
jgi:hypothetical protein